MKYTDNMYKMAQEHTAMKSWHEDMAKSAATQMQDHVKAASWHESQSNMIKGMIEEVPLDPEKKTTSIPAAGSASMPTSGNGMNAPMKEVPMDPDTVKKSDLVAILKSHEAEFGSFDMSVEDIANFLLAD
jgi:hypothetical protein